MEYWILECGTREDLIKVVNVEIGNGWRPLGGVATVPALGYHSSDFFFHQAMVRAIPKIED